MALPVSQVIKQYTLGGSWRNPISGDVNLFTRYAYLRVGTRQAPPYNIDTSLMLDIGTTLQGPAGADTWSYSPDDPSYDHNVLANNTAYERLVGQLGAASQLGSTLTSELRQTWGTVTKTVTNLLFAARAAAKGDIPGVAKHLGFHPPIATTYKTKRRKNRKGLYVHRRVRKQFWVMPNGRHVAKSSGNAWLYYSYGVKPLCEDIYNAMDVLQRPTPETRVSGSCTTSTVQNIGGFYQTRRSFSTSVRCYAYVRAINPNLWLANQLGLVNPAQWVLEGIRLSFLADWVSNLSTVVQSMTDFVGLEVTRPCTTSRYYTILREYHPDYNQPMVKSRMIFKRTLGLPPLRFRVAYERFHWQRGLNAISLLVGLLRKPSYNNPGSLL